MSLEKLMPLIKEAFDRNQTVTIPVTGTSMKPTLFPGDAVTLQEIDAAEICRGDILLYRRSNGQYVLHRVVKIHEDSVDFCGDAQVDVERSVPKSALIARVVVYEKNGCKRSLNYIRNEGKQRLRIRLFRLVATKWHRIRTYEQSTVSQESKRFIGTYLKQQIRSIVAMCLLSCISALSMLGMALASGRVIDKALSGDLHDFRNWFFILFGLLIVVSVCNVLYSNIRVRAVGKMKNAIRRDLFAMLLSKQYSALQKIHSGEILNRMTSDIQLVVENAVTLIPQVFSLGTKLVGGIAFMMFVEPIFTIALVICGAFLALCIQICSRYYKQLHKQCQETEGKTRSYLQECIENLVMIKSFTNENGVLEKLDEYQEENYNKQLRRNFYANVGNTAVYSGFTCAYYAGLAWGVLRIAGVIGAPMSVGTFAALLQIMEQVRSPFRNASGLLPQFYAMLASAERLYEMAALPKENRQSLPISLPSLYDDMISIRLNGVKFAYNDRKCIFKDTDAVFCKGCLTAIVGASGVGKSTLIKLLLGLIHPQSGTVTIETVSGIVEINALTRGLFAYVPQGNMILSGTIAENIAFGNQSTSMEAIRRAASLACLDETLRMLPNDLDTVIGERGVGLSEGQIQRVAVARALLSDAPILLLDECTSALDAETEKRLLVNLSSLKNRTILFISHRTAVLEIADTVFRVNNMQIVKDVDKEG